MIKKTILAIIYIIFTVLFSSSCYIYAEEMTGNSVIEKQFSEDIKVQEMINNLQEKDIQEDEETIEWMYDWEIEDSLHELSAESMADGVVLTWNRPTDGDVYSIFRKKTEEDDWTLIDELPIQTTSYLDSTPIPLESYQYNIQVKNKKETTILALEMDIVDVIWKVTPQTIPAGTVLSVEAVNACGVDNFFYTQSVPNNVFARMKGKSFGDDCTVPLDNLRYIRCLHKDIEGNIKVGELVMNVTVADTVCNIFRQLYDYSYPIERMQLVDDYEADDEYSIMHNNTSAFNYRTVEGTDEISQHAYGLAIDINPYYNVYYVPSREYIFPEDGWEYLDRTQDFPYKLEENDICFNLFTQAGFEWGGFWTYNIDYQHFQYVGN